MKILLIEDDLVDRMAVKRLLPDVWRITEAPTIEQGLHDLAEEAFAVILLDFNLPDGSGLDFLRRMPQVSMPGKTPPVIVFTGKGDEKLVVDVLHAGATDYVAKAGLSGEWLRAAIDRAVELGSGGEASQSAGDYYTILENISDGIFAVDANGLLIYANEQAERVLGIDGSDATGKPLAQVINHPDLLWLRERVDNARRDGQSNFMEGYCRHLSLWLDVRIYPAKSGQGAGVTVYMRDITARMEAEARMDYMATHDELTGLPNRAYLLDQLNSAIQSAKIFGYHLALLFLDCDGFKAINDTLGHHAGDHLLEVIAKRIRRAIRQHDIVARLGGDEFVVLLTELEPGSNLLPAIVDRVQKVMNETVTVQNQQVCITGSIGVCLYPRDGSSAQELIEGADMAMYKAKADGKNTVQWYEQEMKSAHTRHYTLGAQFLTAISADQFKVLYQPEIDLNTGRIAVAEAVVRWNHPRFGTLTPEDFVQAVSETGSMNLLMQWVWEQVCAFMQSLAMLNHSDIRVAVNILSRGLTDDGMVEKLRLMLQKFRIPASSLELELTEAMVLGDPVRSEVVLRGFHELGIKLALDNFGSGYSSISQLKKYPIDCVKIDNEFIREMFPEDRAETTPCAETSSGEMNAALVDSLIRLAHSLNMQVVAVGVDTPGQVLLLAERNCDRVQGQYFCKAMDAEAFIEMLEQFQPMDKGEIINLIRQSA